MPSFDFDKSLSKVAFLVKQRTLDSSSFLTSFIWPSEATTSDKIKTSLSVKATNCLFFTTLYKETRRTFVPLHVTVFLQNVQCLEG